MKRPAKSKKSAKAKKSVKSKKSAKARRPAKARASARSKGSARSKKRASPKKPGLPAPSVATGPGLSANEKAVHFILVRDHDVPVVSPADPTDAELEKVAAHVIKVHGRPPAMTDVVAFGGKPYHYAGGKLRKHPQVHHEFPGTILVLYRGMGNSAVWWSEVGFEITTIAPLHKAAPYPFSVPPVTRPEAGGIWVARSTVPVPGADHNQYKVSYVTESRTIDPHMDTRP